MRQAVALLPSGVKQNKACQALGIAKSTLHFSKSRKAERTEKPLKPSKRALSENEIQLTLGVLNSQEFQDKAPPVVYAKLLDQGRYLCSVRTMYRILAKNK